MEIAKTIVFFVGLVLVVGILYYKKGRGGGKPPSTTGAAAAAVIGSLLLAGQAFAAGASGVIGFASSASWRGVEMMEDHAEAVSAGLRYERDVDRFDLVLSFRGVWDTEDEQGNWHEVLSRFELSPSFDLMGFRVAPYIAAEHLDFGALDDDNLEVGLRVAREFSLAGFDLRPGISVFTDLKGNDRELDYTGGEVSLSVSRGLDFSLPWGFALERAEFSLGATGMDFDISGTDDYVVGWAELGALIRTPVDRVSARVFVRGESAFSGEDLVRDLSASRDRENLFVGVEVRF